MIGVCGLVFVFRLCLVVFGYLFGLFAVWVRGVWVKLIGALMADLSVLSV